MATSGPSTRSDFGRGRALAWLLVLAVLAMMVVVRFATGTTTEPRLPSVLTLR